MNGNAHINLQCEQIFLLFFLLQILLFYSLDLHFEHCSLGFTLSFGISKEQNI